MVMVNINGKMAKYMKGNGLMELKMDQEYGEGQKAIPISDNGKTEKQMDMEFIHGSMEIDIKVNLNNA
jgi:hypothetical protein